MNRSTSQRQSRRLKIADRPDQALQVRREAYARIRPILPPNLKLLHAKFDALSNRALYSREPLQRFWKNMVEQSRGMRIWNIDLGKLMINLIKDFFLTMSFASEYRTGSRAE